MSMSWRRSTAIELSRVGGSERWEIAEDGKKKKKLILRKGLAVQ